MFKKKAIMCAAPLLGVVFSATTAAAAPSLESNCVHSNPTDGISSNAYPSEDCRQLYVLPPEVGRARVSAVAPKQNLDFCPAVRNIGVISSSTLAAAASLAKRLEAMIHSFDPLNAELEHLASRLSAASASYAAAQATFDAAEARKVELTTAATTAKVALDNCRLLANCTTEQAEYTDALNELRAFLFSTHSPAQRALITAKAAYDALSLEYIRKTTAFTAAHVPLFALQDQLFAFEERVRNLYSAYARPVNFRVVAA